MKRYEVDYSYMIPEWATTELTLDPDIKEEDALRQIEETYPDIEMVDIEEIREING